MTMSLTWLLDYQSQPENFLAEEDGAPMLRPGSYPIYI